MKYAIFPTFGFLPLLVPNEWFVNRAFFLWSLVISQNTFYTFQMWLSNCEYNTKMDTTLLKQRKNFTFLFCPKSWKMTGNWFFGSVTFSPLSTDIDWFDQWVWKFHFGILTFGFLFLSGNLFVDIWFFFFRFSIGFFYIENNFINHKESRFISSTSVAMIYAFYFSLILDRVRFWTL